MPSQLDHLRVGEAARPARGTSDKLQFMDLEPDQFDPFVDPRSNGTPLESARPTAQGVSVKGILARTGRNTRSVSRGVSKVCKVGCRLQLRGEATIVFSKAKVGETYSTVREHCLNVNSAN